MCLGNQPKVVQSDPVADQAKIDAEATAKANAASADKKRSQRGSILATGAGYSDSTKKDTFGA